MYKDLTPQMKQLFLKNYSIFFILSIISLFLLLFYNINVGFFGIYYIPILAANFGSYIFGGWEGLLFILGSIILLHYSRIHSSVSFGIFGIILICFNTIYTLYGLFFTSIFNYYFWSFYLGSGFCVSIASIMGYIVINIKLSKYRDPEFEKELKERKKKEIELE